jgi:alcohol dehydrogenase
VGAALAILGGRAADLFGFDRVTRPGLPLVAVPTAAGSGSEVSSHAVIAGLAAKKKEVVAGLHLLPRAAVVDPDWTATLPPETAAWSALDALFHAIEAYLARRATPFTDGFALPALPRIARALPRVLARPDDAPAREELSLGCLYAGCAMANANAGAIHALGYPLTSRYGIPHGLANALMAAATLARTWTAAPERSADLARALGGETGADLAPRVRAFLAGIGIADTLPGRGVAAADLPILASEATHFRPVLDNTPVALAEVDLLAIYRAAYGPPA